MPLEHYGVLVGTLTEHARDRPDSQGRWYHVHLKVQAPLGAYSCAVDVDSKNSATGVQWKVLTVQPEMVPAVAGLAPGYHELAHERSSGALDDIRHPALADLPRFLLRRRPQSGLQRLLGRPFSRRPWTSGSYLEASSALESTLALGRRTLVFGEPFDSEAGVHPDLGVHNIHQNQGDPAGSQWWAENGIWQDGGVMTERPDGALETFISKFSTQASRTDAGGHPI